MDITERLRAEQELLERTTQQEAMNSELEILSYSVSHNLRSPLGVIDGFSRLLATKHAGVLDDKARHHVERIRARTQHMGQIIDDILQLSLV